MIMQNISLNDLTLSETDMQQVKGGIGMLLPAVQKVRDAASR